VTAGHTDGIWLHTVPEITARCNVMFPGVRLGWGEPDLHVTDFSRSGLAGRSYGPIVPQTSGSYTYIHYVATYVQLSTGRKI
jgi:hypothetical protein